MDKWEIINEVELTEDSASIVITNDSNGNPIKLKQAVFNIIAAPSASTTANTSAYLRMMPNLYVFTFSAVVRTTQTQFTGGFEVIAIEDTRHGNMAKAWGSTSSQGTGVYWNGYPITSNAKQYSEYFELYTTGTAKFGAGTKLQLLGIKA